MFDNANRNDADRQAAELAASIQELVRWLTVYVRNRIGHRRAMCQDADDIVNTTIVRVLTRARNRKTPIHHLRAYLKQVADRCLSDHFQQNARQPKSLANVELFVDPDIRLPDRAAEDRELCEQVRPALLKYDELRPRIVNTMSDFRGQLHEFDDIRETLSPLFEAQRERKPRKGHPTKIEQVGHVLEELPGQIALLTEFFLEF